MRVRFAPSPTGKLHVGNVRMALINFLHACRRGGEFILRLDDTDDTRCTEEFARGIREDLTWLGLKWHAEHKQSERMASYQAARDKLINDGRLYACYETSEELNLKRKRLLNAGKPPIYDRAALNLTNEKIVTYKAEGRKPHWRFKLLGDDIVWEDLVRGSVRFQANDLSDPVVIREDGRFLYMLPSVVDDLEMGITDVLRGEDHVSNTAVQVQMFKALGGAAPTFGHFSLITGGHGEALSKRLGSLSLESMRDDGLLPQSIVCALAKLGTPDPIEPSRDIQTVIASFDITKFGRANARFNPDDLTAVNARIVRSLPFDDVSVELKGYGIEGAKAAIFWTTVRANVKKIRDAVGLWPLVSGAITPVIGESDFAALALSKLPEEISVETWSEWTGSIKTASGRKGRQLFMPLRLMLTGMDHGPELAPLLPLMGRARIAARLRGEIA